MEIEEARARAIEILLTQAALRGDDTIAIAKLLPSAEPLARYLLEGLRPRTAAAAKHIADGANVLQFYREEPSGDPPAA